MSVKKVLSVGQCSADHGSISYLFREHFGMEVIAAHTGQDALNRLRRGGVDLVLVNRVFDHDHSSGVNFIAEVKGDADLQQVPIMLVSNYPDAQQKAVAFGALPGFGKADMDEPDTIARLREALDGTRLV
jgi:two-component system chemotaxis response regulator CheY